MSIISYINPLVNYPDKGAFTVKEKRNASAGRTGAFLRLEQFLTVSLDAMWAGADLLEELGQPLPCLTGVFVDTEEDCVLAYAALALDSIEECLDLLSTGRRLAPRSSYVLHGNLLPFQTMRDPVLSQWQCASMAT